MQALPYPGSPYTKPKDLHMYVVKAPWLLKKIYPTLLWALYENKPVCYLSFDDGPTPGITGWVLDQLKEYNAKATFFCIGKNVERHPELYQRILSEGHCTGNHSYSHVNGWKQSTEAYLEDIEKCRSQVDSKLFRPPYGKITWRQIRKLSTHYKIVMWDVISGDFDQSIDGEKCYKNVVTHTRSGSIIVFHDSKKAAPRLQYVLPKILEHFSEKGFLFKSLEGI